MPVGEGQVETVAHDGSGGGGGGSKEEVLGRAGREGGWWRRRVRQVLQLLLSLLPPRLVLNQQRVQVASRSAAKDELQKITRERRE